MSYSLIPFTCRDIEDSVARGVPVHLSRWGDGEWATVVGHYSAARAAATGMGDRAEVGCLLRTVLFNRPDYYLGTYPAEWCMGNNTSKDYKNDMFREVPRFVVRSGFAHYRWCSAHLFAQDALEGNCFANFVRGRDIAVIGPGHAEAYVRKNGFRYVPVPDRHAMHLPTWKTLEIINIATNEVGDNGMCLIAAGAYANLLVHLLRYRRPEISALDVGSWLDYQCGVMSRGWMNG